MNWVDLAILAILATGAVWGYRVGLLNMVLLLVGLIVASRLAGPVGSLFASISVDETVQAIAGFVVVSAVQFIAIKGVAHVWGPVMSWIPLANLTNRLAGSAMGFLFGLMLLLVLMAGIEKIPAEVLPDTIMDATAESTLIGLLANDYNLLARLLKLPR